MNKFIDFLHSYGWFLQAWSHLMEVNSNYRPVHLVSSVWEVGMCAYMPTAEAINNFSHEMKPY